MAVDRSFEARLMRLLQETTLEFFQIETGMEASIYKHNIENHEFQVRYPQPNMPGVSVRVLVVDDAS